jgi:hypothetical protein
VQLVSIAEAPGLTENAAIEEFAVTSPLPQPAIASSAGARNNEKFLNTSRMITFLALTLYSIYFLLCQIDLSQLQVQLDNEVIKPPEEHLAPP